MLSLFGKSSKGSPGGKQKAESRSERLLSDYKRLSGLFKTHPYISIKEVFGSPPEKYHLLYRIDGLHKVGNTIEVKNEHVVEMVLPQKYPSAAPVCTRVSPIFHPNIAPEIIDIKGLWTADTALADLVVKVGEMISFQRFDTKNPINSEAAKWTYRNATMLPLSKVNLSYQETEPPLAEIPGTETEVIIQESPPSDTPPPEDGRKTEGIVIESDTARISIGQEGAEASTKIIELQKTALLDKDKIKDASTVSPAPSAPEKPKPSPPLAPAKKAAVVEQPKAALAPDKQPKPAPVPEVKKTEPPPIMQPVRTEPKPAPAPDKPAPVPEVKKPEPPPVRQPVRPETKPAPAPEVKKTEPPTVMQPVRTEPKPAPAPDKPKLAPEVKKPAVPPPVQQPVRGEPKPVPATQSQDKQQKPAPIPEVKKPAPARYQVQEILDVETSYSIPEEQSDFIHEPKRKETDTIPPTDGFFCLQCGTKNHRGSNYCSNCGTRLWEEVAIKKSSGVRIFLLSAMIAVPVAIVAVGLTLIFSQHKVQAPQAAPAAPTEEKKITAVKVDTAPGPIIPVPKQQPALDTAKKVSSPTTEGVARKLAGTGALSPSRKQTKIEEGLKNAALYLKLGSFEEATNKYMEVLRLDPQNDDALDGLRMVRDAMDKAEARKAAGTDTSKR